MHKVFAPALAALAFATPALAQEAAPTPKFALELNALQPAENACRITFLATNDLGGTLTKASVEMALFDSAGAINRIVTLDFKDLAPGKTKVLQFALTNLDCANLGRVLINDVTACEGEAIAPESCLAGLVPTARPDIIFGV
jgi:hypothetical protein